jgi:hypothetical protein
MLLARHTWGRAPGGNVEDEGHSKRRPEALMALAAAQNTLPSCPSLNAASCVAADAANQFGVTRNLCRRRPPVVSAVYALPFESTVSVSKTVNSPVS